MKFPKIISFANQKGGVGKTTSALQLSFLLSKKDFRVLLVDIDPQANTTSIFFDVHTIPIEETIYTVLKEPSVLKDNFIPKQTKWQNLSILPSTLQLSELEPSLIGAIDGFFRLQDAFSHIKNHYEFIIIDCPPNLGMLTLNALITSDYVIIPLQAAKFSLEGIKTILQTIETLNTKFHCHIQVLGALMTMFNERTTIAKTMLEEMKKYLYLFKTTISHSVIVEESYIMKEPLYTYAPKSKVLSQYQTFTEEVLNEIQKREAY
ncbi:MAG: ParA family protein [Leptospiraceae bacterium]|nr:ParA family protein [Leptospiraceae bacterium]MDW7976132.1 ParA family protein [Leptospiraceae bacterium]